MLLIEKRRVSIGSDTHRNRSLSQCSIRFDLRLARRLVTRLTFFGPASSRYSSGFWLILVGWLIGSRGLGFKGLGFKGSCLGVGRCAGVKGRGCQGVVSM